MPPRQPPKGFNLFSNVDALRAKEQSEPPSSADPSEMPAPVAKSEPPFSPAGRPLVVALSVYEAPPKRLGSTEAEEADTDLKLVPVVTKALTFTSTTPYEVFCARILTSSEAEGAKYEDLVVEASAIHECETSPLINVTRDSYATLIEELVKSNSPGRARIIRPRRTRVAPVKPTVATASPAGTPARPPARPPPGPSSTPATVSLKPASAGTTPAAPAFRPAARGSLVAIRPASAANSTAPQAKPAPNGTAPPLKPALNASSPSFRPTPSGSGTVPGASRFAPVGVGQRSFSPMQPIHLDDGNMVYDIAERCSSPACSGYAQIGKLDGKLYNFTHPNKQPCNNPMPRGAIRPPAQAADRSLTLARTHMLDTPAARNVAPRRSASPDAFAGSTSLTRNAAHLRARQKEGCRLTIAEFAKAYAIDDGVRDKLTAIGFRTMRGLGLMKREQLEAIDSLDCGEAAELIGAIEEWRNDYRE